MVARAIFVLILLFTLSFPAFVSDAKAVANLPLQELIAIIENDKASASDTEAALAGLAQRRAESAPAIPAMLAMLHKESRSNCSSLECVGMDPTWSILRTLQAMGPAAQPAVTELMALLAISSGAVPEPPRPDPLNPFYTCYRNAQCAKEIYVTLKGIGPGASEAVPGLISLAGEMATHPGQNDFREDLFGVLGAIGPHAAASIPVLLDQANKDKQSGAIVAACLAALLQIAPNDPSVFSLFAKAFTRPRSLRLYNSTDQERIDEVFVKKTHWTEMEMRTLALQIKEALSDSNESYQLMSKGRMQPMCEVIKRYPAFASITVPALTSILHAYPANGSVDGLDIVIKTLGSFGDKSAGAVPALAEKALTGGGSVYREEAVAALNAIGTPEARRAVTDGNAL